MVDNMASRMAGREHDIRRHIAELHSVAVFNKDIRRADPVLVIGGRGDPGTCRRFQRSIAAGMIEMVMRVPDLRDRPARLGRRGEIGVRIGRIDGHSLPTCGIMNQIPIIIREAGKLADFKFRHRMRPFIPKTC